MVGWLGGLAVVATAGEEDERPHASKPVVCGEAVIVSWNRVVLRVVLWGVLGCACLGVLEVLEDGNVYGVEVGCLALLLHNLGCRVGHVAVLAPLDPEFL